MVLSILNVNAVRLRNKKMDINFSVKLGSVSYS